jgi:hypothetical protein
LNEFSSIPHSDDLLKALKRDKTVDCGPPSLDVIRFIERVESADPNDPNLSEDDTNAGWGHAQFSGYSTIITDWKSIGIDTACRLLAAAIKTCQVARHICNERNITATNYLSDAYLTNVVELLWEAKKKASGGVSNLFNVSHFINVLI